MSVNVYSTSFSTSSKTTPTYHQQTRHIVLPRNASYMLRTSVRSSTEQKQNQKLNSYPLSLVTCSSLRPRFNYTLFYLVQMMAKSQQRNFVLSRTLKFWCILTHIGQMSRLRWPGSMPSTRPALEVEIARFSWVGECCSLCGNFQDLWRIRVLQLGAGTFGLLRYQDI